MTRLKVPGANLAVGYWGRRPDTHVQALQIPEKVLALNFDKIRTLGLAFKLYTRLTGLSEPRSIQCSCFSDTAQQSDSPCLSCYGMCYQPGYLKFGHRTLFYSSTHTDMKLNNLQLNTVVTPYRLQLTPTALSGSIVTPPFPIVDINLGTWEFKLDTSLRDPANIILGEFSIDAGAKYYDLSLLGTVGYNPTITQTIQFRVTLSRPGLNTKSPVFEILRARYPIIPPLRYSDMNPGEILLLKTWDVERYVREKMGNSTENVGQHYWTLPLHFFDRTIDRESKEAALSKDHFVEEARGPEAGTRYISTKHQYSRTFKAFTSQSFDLRRVIGDLGDTNSGESTCRVW